MIRSGSPAVVGSSVDDDYIRIIKAFLVYPRDEIILVIVVLCTDLGNSCGRKGQIRGSVGEVSLLSDRYR